MLYLFPASYLRLWDGRPPSNTTTSSRVSYSPGPTSFYLRVLEVPRVPRANMAAQLGSADESSRRRRSAEVQGPCLPAGTTAELSRSVQDVSPGAEASCLSSASAYGPSRTARLLTGISEGMLALEFEAPKSLSKIVLAAHFPSGVRVFPSIFGLPVSFCVLTSFRP